MTKTMRRFILTMILMIMVPVSGLLCTGPVARAATVTCKSKYYVTTKINKNKLKKGQKAKVTISIYNTSGDVMKNLKIKVALPAELKKVKGSLSKSKSSLNKKKTCTCSFYVKAKKPVSFSKKVATSRKVSGLTTKIVAANLIKYGKKNRYLKVAVTFKKPAATTAAKPATTSAASEAPSSYADAMVSLLANLNTYAKSKKSNFAMISNGGYNLYASDAPTKDRMLAAVDGVLIEDAFTNSDKKAMQEALLTAVTNGKKAFSIEYEGSPSGSAKIVSFKNAPEDLDAIVQDTAKGVSYDVNSLAQVKDFMAILDPKNYKKTKDKTAREVFIEAINKTDYDLIFIDLFFGYDENGVQKPWTASEIDGMKRKASGGKRKVCAYLSVGEAENYRYYWQPAWNTQATRPAWIAEENKNWKGNFKVRYWQPEWQSILYGSSNAYLDRILDAGFDGVYLDVIDAYEYFEKKK